MTTTKFKNDIIVGAVDGEPVFLKSPSWDCGWYWGFGYIANSFLHTHFDSIGNSSMHDNILQYFDSFILNGRELWTFCELMKSFYTLKKTAELLGRGGYHYAQNPCKELIQNKEETARINDIVMPAIFDAIHDLLQRHNTKQEVAKLF